MLYNKGRLIPSVRPLSEFRQENSRSPFDGEMIFDDVNKTNDLGFWSKNQNNVWECHERTKEIQDEIDSYGSSGDNTFQNASAFYESGVIHKFFFSQKDQKVWLDNSIDISKFSYYAILGIKEDNGKCRYITGLSDSDGTNYVDALIPTGMRYGKLVKEVFINTWYIVEFYDDKKELVHSVNYLSHQTLVMPIDLVNEPSGKENTVTNVKLIFDKMDNNGYGIIREGESLDSIHPILRLTMSDGHIVDKTDVEDISLENFDNIDTNVIGENIVRAKYKVFDTSSSTRKIFKYFKDVVFYYDSISQKPYVKVVMPEIENGMYNREYKEVRVRGIGNSEAQYVTDFEIEQDDDGNDVICIPCTYFKIEKNSIVIYYTETTDTSLVKSDSLYIPVENIIRIIPKEVFEYSNFKAVGYVSNVGGENKVFYKFYVLQNNIVKEITDLVTIVLPDDYASGRINRLVAKFVGHEEVFFSYFMDPNVSGNNRVITSSSRADLGTSPESVNTPTLLYSTGYSDFTLGMGSFSRSNPVDFSTIADLISPNVNLIRIKNVKNNKYMSVYVRDNTFTYTPSHSIYMRIPNNAKTVKDVVSKVSQSENHSITYRIVKCKNKILKNELSERTVKELLQNLTRPSDEFGTFIGYSVSNGWLLNDTESERIIKTGEKLYYYEWFAADVSNLTDTLPQQFDGLIELKYTLNRIIISNNDCFLIEGYNSSDKTKCLGSVIAHAAVRI